LRTSSSVWRTTRVVFFLLLPVNSCFNEFSVLVLGLGHENRSVKLDGPIGVCIFELLHVARELSSCRIQNKRIATGENCLSILTTSGQFLWMLRTSC
jgi:hypothetical protein